MGAGRKNKYDTHVKPRLNVIAAWARSGLTIEQIAKNLQVGKSTFCTYMNKNQELRDSLKENRDEADYAIENALYNKALDGDNTAMIFWLKNRQSAKWRDRQEIESKVTFGLAELTDEQADSLIKQFIKGD